MTAPPVVFPLGRPGAGPALPGRLPKPLQKAQLTAWQRATADARRLTLGYETTATKAVDAAIDRHIADVTKGLTQMPASDAARRNLIRRRERQMRAAAQRFRDGLQDAIDKGIRLTDEAVAQVWTDARTAVTARIRDKVRDTEGLLKVTPRRVRAAASFEQQALGGAGSLNWKTALKGHANSATAEIDAIVSDAILRGESATALARKLRRHVLGAEQFDAVFGAGAQQRLWDMRGVPKHLQKAAGQVRYNALRIAVSEIARAERAATLESLYRDPMVSAVKWTPNKNRGKQRGSCVCDMLATNNFYGLGNGIYPFARAPRFSHPFCRCRLMPVAATGPLSPTKKPRGRFLLDPAAATLPGVPAGPAGSPVPPRLAAARRRATEILQATELGAQR